MVLKHAIVASAFILSFNLGCSFYSSILQRNLLHLACVTHFPCEALEFLLIWALVEHALNWDFLCLSIHLFWFLFIILTSNVHVVKILFNQYLVILVVSVISPIELLNFFNLLKNKSLLRNFYNLIMRAFACFWRCFSPDGKIIPWLFHFLEDIGVSFLVIILFTGSFLNPWFAAVSINSIWIIGIT
jgi:hypothetical protein